MPAKECACASFALPGQASPHWKKCNNYFSVRCVVWCIFTGWHHLSQARWLHLLESEAKQVAAALHFHSRRVQKVRKIPWNRAFSTFLPNGWWPKRRTIEAFKHHTLKILTHLLTLIGVTLALYFDTKIQWNTIFRKYFIYHRQQ